MFGKSPKLPTPPSYIPPAPYQAPPPYQASNPDPSRSNLNMFIPQAPTAGETSAEALGVANTGSSERNLLEYGPWLSLQNNPLSSENVKRAEANYKQLEVAPAIGQLQSQLQASGQGGSSYAGAAIGQQQAMGNLLGFNAALNQRQTEFGNVLAARNALYSQPIAQTAQANADRVNRAFGIAGLDYQNSANNAAGQNAYNLANTGGQNAYNLGTNQFQNNFGQQNYQNQLGQYGIQMQNATNRALGIGGLGLGITKLFSGGGGGGIGQFASGIGQGMFGGGGAASPNMTAPGIGTGFF